MRATLIFDNVNDLLFSKWDDKFLERMKFFNEQVPAENITDSYNVSQLLSPVITSQRVMAAQFGNTYSSMQCKDKTTIVFDEVSQVITLVDYLPNFLRIPQQFAAVSLALLMFLKDFSLLDLFYKIVLNQFNQSMSRRHLTHVFTLILGYFGQWLDHIFLKISEETVDDAHRELLDCKTCVQHICGQNVNLLHSTVYQDWLSVLLESRNKGDSIPGASGMIGESGATGAALNALKTAAKDIKCSPHQHCHLMLFVGDKLLALYSRGSEDLTPPDLILLSMQCIAAQEYWNGLEDDAANSSLQSPHLPWLSEENSAIVHLCTSSNNYPCAPHSMHLVQVAPRVVFALLVDMDLRDIGIATYMSNQVLCNLRKLLLQRNLELLPSTLDSLEAALKKTTDALRKNKANGNLCARLTSRMLELRKSCTTTTPLTPETTATAMHTALEAVVDQLKPDIPSLKLAQAMKDLKSNLTPYLDFLRVKAMRYFSMGSGETDSCSLTLHKYVEEFPGLIHFIYIDRATGRFLAPDMADCADMLSRSTVRGIVSRALCVFREGYAAGAWRRGALHVVCAAWWSRGHPGATHPAPRRAPHPAAVRALPPPGDILGTFYKQLVELAFPNESQGVAVKELICVHLGLLPATTAVQQARRLAHTVHELAGDSHANASDLL